MWLGPIGPDDYEPVRRRSDRRRSAPVGRTPLSAIQAAGREWVTVALMAAVAAALSAFEFARASRGLQATPPPAVTVRLDDGRPPDSPP